MHFFHFLDGNRVKLFRKFSLFSFLESIFRDFLKKNFLFYGKFSRDWTDFQRSLKTIYTIFDNFHIFILREALTYAKLFSLKNFFLHTKIYISCFHFLESALENFSPIKKFSKIILENWLSLYFAFYYIKILWDSLNYCLTKWWKRYRISDITFPLRGKPLRGSPKGANRLYFASLLFT